MSATFDQLVLRLDAHFALRSAAVCTNGQLKPWADLSRLPPATRTVGVCQSPAIGLVSVDVPGRNQQKFREAVGFALEDQLLGDVETLHFVLPDRLQDRDTAPVAYIDRALLRHELDRLAKQGIVLDALLPEALALPPQVGLIDQGMVSVNSDNFAGQIEAATAARRLSGEVRVLSTERGASTVPVRRIENPMDAWLQPWPKALPINLLQGAFARRSEQKRPTLWLAAAALLLLAIGLHVASVWTQRQQALANIAALEAQVVADLQRIGGAQVRISADPLRQLQAELSRRSGVAVAGSGMLDLIATAGPVLSGENKLELAGMLYRDNALALNYRAPDLSAIEALVQRLRATPGLQTEMGDTRFEEGRSTGRITLTAKTP